MRSTAPPSRKAGQVGSLSGHAARITDLRTLSWSSGAAHPPGCTSRFPPSLRRSTASKGRFLIPLVVPWLAQHKHPYTSPTRGRVSSPRGSGTVPQSRSQGRAPSAPRAGSPRCPCACGAYAAPRPPPAEAIRAGSALGAGGGWLVLGSWGFGGVELAGVRVDVVEVVVVVVVVVGVVRRHLLDAGGDAPHRLHVRLRGRPAPRPPPVRPALPPGLPCPVPPVPRGPRRPCPCPWAPFRPPARAVGPAPCPPRPGPPSRPPSLASLPAPGCPAHAAARPFRALVPSRPPALSRAVRCLRSVPLRCCALAPCRACPGLLLARAPAHSPCRPLSPAPRSRGWHAALPARRPLLPGSRAGRPAVFAAAAA